MGRRYEQLSLGERHALFRLHEAGAAVSEIAGRLGRHRSTIYRELRRNRRADGDYLPETAQRFAWARRLRGSRIERLSRLGALVRDRLAMGWSPEQIAGRLRRERSEHAVSHEAIYRFVYSPVGRRGRLHRCLCRAKARRGRRARKSRRAPMIGLRAPIRWRPSAASSRSQFGHWEGDLMHFRRQRDALLTLHERKTRLTVAAPLPSKSADLTAGTIIARLAGLPRRARRSITLDNGGEFARHDRLERELGLRACFCDPYCAWQRGGIENANGVLRRDVPRHATLSHYTAADLDDLAWAFNTTPRKCLGFRTPLEAFAQQLGVALET
jgi:transposase, IS30 family